MTAIGLDWPRVASPSVEDLVIEMESSVDSDPDHELELEASAIEITDPRARVLSWLITLLGAEDRDLLLATTDGATLAEIARRQGADRSGLAYRRDLLIDWLAYCAPIRLEIAPLLADMDLDQAQRRWWVWHAGGQAASISALERRVPAFAVTRRRWILPRRSLRIA